VDVIKKACIMETKSLARIIHKFGQQLVMGV
jgi:hypothetical protein